MNFHVLDIFLHFNCSNVHILIEKPSKIQWGYRPNFLSVNV